MDYLTVATSNRIGRELHQAVLAFVARIVDIARRAAIEQLESAFIGMTAHRAPHVPARGTSSGRGRGRPPGPGMPNRTESDLRKLETLFATFVEANPGMRIERINERLGTTTQELALPVRRLVAEGTVAAKGKNRATRYFMAGTRPVTQPS